LKSNQSISVPVAVALSNGRVILVPTVVYKAVSSKLSTVAVAEELSTVETLEFQHLLV
jgi:hypothetical protein